MSDPHKDYLLVREAIDNDGNKTTRIRHCSSLDEAQRQLEAATDAKNAARRGDDREALHRAELAERKAVAEFQRHSPPVYAGFDLDAGRGNGNHDPDDLRAVRSGREHRAMFPSLRDERVSFEGFGDFALAMRSGRHDDRLEARAMTGAVGSDGGYSVPIQWERYVIDLALQNEVVRPLVKNIPMTARTVRIPGWNTTDLSAGGVGGAIGYWVDETGTITASNPKQRQVELNAKKLAILERSSLELTEDALDFGAQVADQIAKTLGHYLDKALVRGSGAGEPQGILNAPCKLAIAAEDGQVGSTLVLENAVKAYARMLPVAQRRMVWLAHPDTIPEMYTFSLSLGTAGSWVSPMSEQSGQFRLFGRPVYFTSHCSTVGTEGDLIALDPESYAVGILGGSMRMDYSDHVYFDSAERAFRALIRVDGQCLVEDEITPAQGSNTWSPIITVATR